MNTLTATEREHWEDTYFDNSPLYYTLNANHGEWLPNDVATKIARQHGTSVEELVIQGGVSLKSLPMGKPMVNTLDFVMALGY